MIAVNEKVILRQDGNSWLLFDLTRGTMTEINQTGSCIWNALLAGMDEQEIVGMFRTASPQTPHDELAESVHHFLAMLAGKNYISGFDGAPVPPQFDDGGGERKTLENLAIYDLSSMKRVFVPGDALLLAEIPFVAFRKGDIAVYYPNGTAQPGIVHRVIRRTKDTLTTMGDNNPAPDRYLLSPADAPKLVVAKIRPDGKEFAVARGMGGMRQFRINRLRYWLCRITAKLIRIFLPLMFWRKEITGKYEFDKTIQYYYKRRMVAKSVNGIPEFTPFWNILRYKLPKEK